MNVSGYVCYSSGSDIYINVIESPYIKDRWKLYGGLLITIVYVSIENTDKLLCAIWSLGNVTQNEFTTPIIASLSDGASM